MSSKIVLPQLNDWAQMRITDIFKATTQSAFNDAFNAFVAADTDVIFHNGKKLTREQYMQQLWQDKFLEAGAEVQYYGVVSALDKTGFVSVLSSCDACSRSDTPHSRSEKWAFSSRRLLLRSSWSWAHLRQGPSCSLSTCGRYPRDV